MTAAENKNNRNCKSLVFGARWLVIKKNLARDKKDIDCAGSRETKHGKALSWPCFAATAKKKWEMDNDYKSNKRLHLLELHSLLHLSPRICALKYGYGA